MIRSKYAVFFLALLAVSCSRSREDYAEEDYNKLFPFGGIEKPRCRTKTKLYSWVTLMPLYPTLSIQE